MSIIDIEQIKIDHVKRRAIPSKYYNLFADKLPANVDSALLYCLNNSGTILKFMQRDPLAEFVVYDDQSFEDIFKSDVFKDFNITFYSDDEYDYLEVYNIIMIKKFDRIIMNPPYQRSLHLKILSEAVKHLKEDEDDSKCVNLSPSLWLEDPLAQTKKNSNYYKYEDSISKKLHSFEIVGAVEANELFGIGLFANLGIYTCKRKNGDVQYSELWKKRYASWEIDLFEKIRMLPEHLADKIEKNEKDGIRVLIACIAGNGGPLPVYKDLSYVVDGLKDGKKDWTKCKILGDMRSKKEAGSQPVSNSTVCLRR